MPLPRKTWRQASARPALAFWRQRRSSSRRSFRTSRRPRWQTIRDAAFFADLDPPQTFALRADEVLGNERQTVEIWVSDASEASAGAAAPGGVSCKNRVCFASL